MDDFFTRPGPSNRSDDESSDIEDVSTKPGPFTELDDNIFARPGPSKKSDDDIFATPGPSRKMDDEPQGSDEFFTMQDSLSWPFDQSSAGMDTWVQSFMNRGSCVDISMDHAECKKKIKSFKEITRADTDTAQFYLKSSSWEIDEAVANFYENNSPHAAEEKMCQDSVDSERSKQSSPAELEDLEEMQVLTKPDDVFSDPRDFFSLINKFDGGCSNAESIHKAWLELCENPSDSDIPEEEHREKSINFFKEATRIDKDKARVYLERSAWQMDTALINFFEENAESQNQSYGQMDIEGQPGPSKRYKK